MVLKSLKKTDLHQGVFLGAGSHKALGESNENRPTSPKTHRPTVLGAISGISLESGLRIPEISNIFLFHLKLRCYYSHKGMGLGKRQNIF